MQFEKNKFLRALFLCTVFAVDMARSNLAVADSSTIVNLRELTNKDLLGICNNDPSECNRVSEELGRAAMLELYRIQIEKKTYCEVQLFPQMKTKQDIADAGLAYIKKNNSDPEGHAVKSFMSAIAPNDPCKPN